MKRLQPCAWTAAALDSPAPLSRKRKQRLEHLPTHALREGTLHSNFHPMVQRKTREQILAVLAGSTLEMVYQPALRLDEPKVAFFEALARIQSRSGTAPADWFSSAKAVGLGVELELLAAKSAVAGLPSLPNGAVVSINISPATAVSPAFASFLGSIPLEKIIVEVTEQEAVRCYDRLQSTLAPFRKRGLRVAVDDAGAGYASFRHILHIRPDIIKLDMTLCRRIDEDPLRQALVSALITFSRQIGSELVAEGVESADELQCLRELGMAIIQGHFADRPMSLKANGSAACCQPLQRASANTSGLREPRRITA